MSTNLHRLQIELTKLTPVKVFLHALKEKYAPGRQAMSRKERACRAIEFKGPDRVPHQKLDFWFLFHNPPQSWQPPDGYYPYVHPGFVSARAWKWKARRGTSWLKEDRTAIDEFGTIWRASGRTSLGETVKCPLEDGWHMLDGYELPDMKDFSRFEQSARLSKWLDGDRYRLGVDTNSIRERFQYLRGFENSMTDLVLHADESERLLDMLTHMTVDMVDSFHRAGADGFMLVDDWGSQNGPLVSPRHFERFFLPRYKRISDHCHKLGMHCGLHSCGDIRALVPLMIESGLDFLQLDSPNMCGIDWLSENAAGRICIFASVDIQNVYPKNDPARIESYVHELKDKLATKDGGLVAWPYAETWVIGVGIKSVWAEERAWKK
ncbi:MAG: uroporphyrinogen decarboxylase family protein [bacterium]